jgi:hypothetical protein
MRGAEGWFELGVDGTEGCDGGCGGGCGGPVF